MNTTIQKNESVYPCAKINKNLQKICFNIYKLLKFSSVNKEHRINIKKKSKQNNSTRSFHFFFGGLSINQKINS